MPTPQAHGCDCPCTHVQCRRGASGLAFQKQNDKKQQPTNDNAKVVAVAAVLIAAAAVTMGGIIMIVIITTAINVRVLAKVIII